MAERQQAVAIRNHVLALVPANGKRHQYGCAGAVGPCRLTTWKRDTLRFVLREPFDPFGTQAAAQGSVSQRPATGIAPLPFGLDIWQRGRVLSLAWDETCISVVSFRSGEWQAQALALDVAVTPA
jgi:hypothetical protein